MSLIRLQGTQGQSAEVVASVARHGSFELTMTVHNMANRIRELEEALSAMHSPADGATQHPLLRPELLIIKEIELPGGAEKGTQSQPALTETFGALAISEAGTSRWYGPTAGNLALLSAQGSSGSDRAEYARHLVQLTTSFPFSPSNCGSSYVGWDVPGSLVALVKQLPTAERAAELCEIYIAEASWHATLVLADDLRELCRTIYAYAANPARYSLAIPHVHSLAVLFLALAMAALADLSLPAYSPEADALFDAGQAALALESVFVSRELRTIQALAMAATYLATGGPRYSIDASWALNAMAMVLAERLRLHRETTHRGLHPEQGRLCRALFWELFSLETYSALTFSRPLTIPFSEITCEFPEDWEAAVTTDGLVVPGFLQTKWKFTREVTAPFATIYSRSTPPTFDEVLELDRRLRQFMEGKCHVMARYASEGSSPGDSPRDVYFRAYSRANMIPRFCGNLLLYLHRSFFLQTIKETADDLLSGPYATSFLAAYRGALLVVKSDTFSFELFSERFHRWWPIWKSLGNAAFILGSVVCKSPRSEFAPAALESLREAVRLLDAGATHSFLAAGHVPALRRLQNTAQAVFAAAHPDLDPSSTNLRAREMEMATEEDFQMLSGSRPIVELGTQTTTSGTGFASTRSSPDPLDAAGAATLSVASMPPPLAPTAAPLHDYLPAPAQYSSATTLGYAPPPRGSFGGGDRAHEQQQRLLQKAVALYWDSNVSRMD
ncbi:Zn(2)-C6 fungal-type domain-containing protein [Mycena kentingensis (nom. inval.)]|nr:Zn(2)-C6 fungal-type domain-containing protein [Mycena kentingensis (nom. inval.)]